MDHLRDSNPSPIQLIPVTGLPILSQNDYGQSLAKIFSDLPEEHPIHHLEITDILAISHTFIGKLYGYIENLASLELSPTAGDLSNIMEINPAKVQLILNHSRRIVRVGKALITENKAGIVGANSGVDKSNVPGELNYMVIPENPDELARLIQKDLEDLFSRKVPVMITDSVGRPFRKGSIGVAIGSVDIPSLLENRGKADLYGYHLKSSEVAYGDLLASAADLVMGQSDEAVPVVIIRGVNTIISDSPEDHTHAADLQRLPENDMFRNMDWETLMKYRRSYKLPFSPQKVPIPFLLKAIRMSTFAPNAHNNQCWRFVHFGSKKEREKLIYAMEQQWEKDLAADEFSQKAKADLFLKSRQTFMQAPELLLMAYDRVECHRYSDPQRQNAEYTLAAQSVAAAATMFFLALEGLGLAGCWYSAGLFAAPSIKHSLNLPDTWEPQLLITVGFPQEKRYNRPERRPLGEIFFTADDFV